MRRYFFFYCVCYFLEPCSLWVDLLQKKSTAKLDTLSQPNRANCEFSKLGANSKIHAGLFPNASMDLNLSIPLICIPLLLAADFPCKKYNANPTHVNMLLVDSGYFYFLEHARPRKKQ